MVITAVVKDNTGKWCIIYVRVSTEEQAQKYSLPSQIEKCREKAHALGYTDDRILVIQDSHTGAEIDRPGMNELREYIAAHEASAVIIYDPDRLARNLKDQLILTDEIERSGAKLHFVSTEFENSPEGRLFYNMRGIIAEYERGKIKERMVRGRMQKAKRGEKMPTGDPRIIGYRYNKETDLLEVDPEYAPVVKNVFKWYLDGDGSGAPLSAHAIARKLAQFGIVPPRGRSWYTSSVISILENDTYTGTFWAYKWDYHTGARRRRPREEQFPISVEPLVDEETFRLAQKRLKHAREKYAGRGRPCIEPQLLSGLLYCGDCGCKMHIGGAKKNRENYYRYYICSGKLWTEFDPVSHGERPDLCRSVRWRADKLDQIVWSFIKEMLSDPSGFVDKMSSANAASNDGALQEELNTINERIKKLKDEEARLVFLFTSQRIDTELYDESRRRFKGAISALESRKDEIQNTIDQLKQSEQRRGDAVGVLEEYRRRLTHIDELSAETKQRICRKLIDKIIVSSNGDIEIYGVISYKKCRDSQSHRYLQPEEAHQACHLCGPLHRERDPDAPSGHAQEQG